MNRTPSRQSASPTVKASIAPAAPAALGRHLLRLLAAYLHDLKCQTPGPPGTSGAPAPRKTPFFAPYPATRNSTRSETVSSSATVLSFARCTAPGLITCTRPAQPSPLVCVCP